MSAGILCGKQILELIRSTSGKTCRIYNEPGGLAPGVPTSDASINLPLGGCFWEMRGSCRTGASYKVRDLIDRHALNREGKLLSKEPVTLKRRSVYLFKSDYGLDLCDTYIQGKATGRSSIGRLDVLVRLLVDGSNSFDFARLGEKHELYIEVTPISFDLSVERGTCLSQLRLFKGREDDISLTLQELYHEEDEDFPVLTESGELSRDPCKNSDGIWFPFRLDLSPDPVTDLVAFVAKRPEELRDADPIDPSMKGHYDPAQYWDPVPKSADGTILLSPDRLYILRSKERLRIPGHLALECKSYTTQMGEWRIEYAGFAHPYFGCLRDDKKGSPIIFEVRGHNVPTILTDGIPLGNVRFLRMSQVPERPQSSPTYEKQELALSSCFKPWSSASA